ncbi:MAG: rhodanese-like domain-containing protein [Bacteroidia bacterium]|jgi:glyoxylase-like metal-dependent hydrolase (beta-lactamase superfamily II)/rhodanese-related sulfurtransferase
MHIQQLYTNCLAQAAYYIESEGEAAIVDPLRDYDTYVKMAESRGAKIKYIFETHFHADFVSGHIDLAKKTGAQIVYGPTTVTSYPVHVASDKEVLKLGKISIQVLHTPGHTPESSCFLLKDENGKDHAVFTGDTLFVGDVGRPDLLDGVMTKEELAGMMYDSLHHQLMPLADEVLVYPAHGAGSACGKNIGKETFSTMGQQKQTNYALQPMSKDLFIQTLTDGIQPAPAYFFKDAQLNKQGYASMEEVLKQGLTPLDLQSFEDLKTQSVVIIDTRNPEVFELGFVPGSINFGLNGQYAIWAATLLDIAQPVAIVAEPGKEQESVERLTRVGFDKIQGYLKGGFQTWLDAGKRYDMVITVDEEEFELDAKHTDIQILDVRRPGEWDEMHLKKATHVALGDINKNYTQLDKDGEYLVHCAGGYRSMIAASFLKSKGFQRVKNVQGGFAKIKNMKLEMVSGQTGH